MKICLKIIIYGFNQFQPLLDKKELRSLESFKSNEKYKDDLFFEYTDFI